MTEKYIYADVEKPFHFWVREGKRWILRDGGPQQQDGATRTHTHGANRHSPPHDGSRAA
jgi:hypothetical protein